MSIDGIGGPGRKGPLSGTPEVAGPAGTDFKQSLAADAASPISPSGTSAALERLTRGELDLNQYLDIQVSDAVSHLKGRLSPEQLAFVSTSLREQLSSDPVLLELVRRATGATPSEPAG